MYKDKDEISCSNVANENLRDGEIYGEISIDIRDQGAFFKDPQRTRVFMYH